MIDASRYQRNPASFIERLVNPETGIHGVPTGAAWTFEDAPDDSTVGQHIVVVVIVVLAPLASAT